MFYSNFRPAFVQQSQPYMSNMFQPIQQPQTIYGSNVGQPVYRQVVQGQPQYHSYVPQRPVFDHQQPRFYSYQPVLKPETTVVANPVPPANTQPVPPNETVTVQRVSVGRGNLDVMIEQHVKAAMKQSGSHKIQFEVFGGYTYPDTYLDSKKGRSFSYDHYRKDVRDEKPYVVEVLVKDGKATYLNQSKQAQSTSVPVSQVKIKTAASVQEAGKSLNRSAVVNLFERRRLKKDASKSALQTQKEIANIHEQEVTKSNTSTATTKSSGYFGSEEHQKVQANIERMERELEKLKALTQARKAAQFEFQQKMKESDKADKAAQLKKQVINPVKAPVQQTQVETQQETKPAQQVKQAPVAPVAQPQQQPVEKKPAQVTANPINYARPQQQPIPYPVASHVVYSNYQPIYQNGYSSYGFVNAPVMQYQPRYAMPSYGFGNQVYSQIACF